MRRGIVALLLVVSVLLGCEQSGPASAVGAGASHTKDIASGRSLGDTTTLADTNVVTAIRDKSGATEED